MALILERRKDGVVELWFEGVLADRGLAGSPDGEVIELEEYDGDNCNGGQPTGEIIYAVLGHYKCDLPEIGKGIDGLLYFSPKYKYPLFRPIIAEHFKIADE